MKKEYITPSQKCVTSMVEPLMAASPSFSGETKYDPTKPATELEVTSKHHTLWNTTWDETDEDDE